MANATFVQDGCAIDYTPTAAVAAGDVIAYGGLIGIAKRDIEANVMGALSIDGVYAFKKSGSSGPVFAIGEDVFWDFTNKLAVATGAGAKFIGTAVKAAATTDTVVRVLLRQLDTFDVEAGLTWEDVTLAGGSKTLDAEDVGKVLNVTVGHATNVITLPSTAAGLEYLIRCGTTGQRVAVSPAAADKIMGPDFAGVDNKDRILTAATALEGDFIQLEADGVNGWFVTSQRGIWVNEA